GAASCPSNPIGVPMSTAASAKSKSRLSKLRRQIKQEGFDSLLVTNFKNVTYLTGFTGDDSYLLVTPKTEILLSDPRYTTQLEEECPGLTLEIREPGTSILESVAKTAKKAKVKALGFEASSMTVGTHHTLAEKLGSIEFISASGL